MKKHKLKGSGQAARQVLAEKLELLAAALREGRFSFEGESWPVDKDVLEYHWELKIKEGKLKFALTLALDQEVRPQSAPKSRASKKQIKKAMGASFKAILRKLKQEELPFLADVEELLQAFKDYEPFVENSWRRPWFLCAEKVLELHEAVKGGDIARAKEISSAILAYEKDCHRKYK